MLAYEGAGNYTKFSEIVAKSGLLKFIDGKYVVYNTMQAFSIQGILGLDWCSSGVSWFFQDLSNARGLVFGGDLIDCEEMKGSIFYSGSPLAFRRFMPEGEYSNSLETFTQIGCVADNVLLDDPNIGQISQDIEYYSFTEGKWVASDSLTECDAIVRIKEKYSGYRYFIFLPKIKKLYKFTNPEWLFVVGLYICSFKMSEIFIFGDDFLEHHGSLRLPKLFFDHLYLNCDALKIGYKNKYVGLKREAIDDLLSYMKEGVLCE